MNVFVIFLPGQDRRPIADLFQLHTAPRVSDQNCKFRFLVCLSFALPFWRTRTCTVSGHTHKVRVPHERLLPLNPHHQTYWSEKRETKCMREPTTSSRGSFESISFRLGPRRASDSERTGSGYWKHTTRLNAVNEHRQTDLVYILAF